MDIKVQLGMRIRYLRKKKKLSIEDLALKADINRNYLGCGGLDVTLEFLFKGIVPYDELFWKKM